MKRAEQTLLGLVAASLAVAAPTLLAQWENTARARAALGGMTFEERAAAVDNPAVTVAREIARAVPEDACVAVLAYAGPAAIDYYNARLDYLLYPRRAQVFANTNAQVDDCDYLAVFRDTQQNLQAEPFAGQWDSAALAERTQALEAVETGAVKVYREGP